MAKSNSKNLVKLFLAKSKSFTKYSKLSFFTPWAKLVFTELWHAFLMISIFYHFDLKYDIYIEIDISRYIIDKVLSYLNIDDLDWWYLVAFIPIKIIYY